jgi:membrane-bound lytic murein transglycosylase D
LRTTFLLVTIAAVVGALTYALAGATRVAPGAADATAEPVPLELAATGLGALADVDAAAEVAEVMGEAPEAVDEILATPMLTHPDFVSEVRRWVAFWETAPAQWFPEYLARMSSFEEIVDTTLAAHGLPWSLRYLPVIESGYSPTAVSKASAVGLWQFMAHTASDFDIEISTDVDDRRDPFVSTAAAADFLVELHERFGSWFLALAAYNAGPDRIEKLIERHAPDAERSDALYWALRPYLPRETADFVPNLFGAIIVASDPEAHGYTLPAPAPFDFEAVPVLGRVSFDAAARATGTTRAEIARLNPEYVRGVTPGDEVVDLRVPPGRGQAFRDYFAALGGAGAVPSVPTDTRAGAPGR